MANEEQLAHLKQGIDYWNAWRQENDSIKIDLREADLRGAALHEANLAGVRLIGAQLVETNLESANLTGCQIYGISAWHLFLLNFSPGCSW